MGKTATDLIATVAAALAKTTSIDTQAHILNGLLSCDGEPSLSDAEVEAGEALFNALAALSPQAVREAKQM